MSPRKVQLDWKIGIKHCPCGQPNHLDETHCVKCGFGFGSASPRSRQPFKMRRVYRFLFLTALVTYLTLYLSSPRIPTLQTIALAQTTEANIEIIQNRLLALTSAVDWQKLWLTIETSSEDWILTLATQVQTLEQQFTSWNEKIGQFELPSAQKVAQAQRDQKETAGTTSIPFPATPTPTPIPTAIRTNLDLVLDVQVQLGNVRTGPGMNYEIIGKVQEGDRLDDIIEESSGWYRFCCVDGDKLGWLHSSLATASHSGKLPPHLKADPYYQKYLDAGGVPILAPASVADEELLRAQAITLAMVADRPDLLDVLAAQNTRILLYDSERGGLTQLPEFADSSGASGIFGETSYGFAAAAPTMTTYHCNETLIHEIAHALDYAIQKQEWEAFRGPEFKKARNRAFLSAKEARLWAGSYASTISDEYWAEMVVHWLRPDMFRIQFGLRNLSEYDSAAARLIEQYLGNPTLPDFCETRQFAIRGRVLDESGNPMPDVWVTLSAWRSKGDGFVPLRRYPDVVAKRTGLDGRFWIVEAVDPGLLEAADFFTLGLWRGAPAEWWPACSIAGYTGKSSTVVKQLGRARRIEVTGQDLSGYTITVPAGFDWSPRLDCQ